MSINRVMITGNLTRDPELRQTTGGTSVLSFGVAVNDRRRNNQTGEWEDYPNFIDCQMFGKRADALRRYLSKGSKVAVEGKLSQDRWQDRQTGQNRSRIRVTVDELEFMSSRNGGGNGGYQNNNGYQQGGSYQGNGGYQGGNQFASGQDNGYSPAPASAPNPAVDGSVYDEDIPF